MSFAFHDREFTFRQPDGSELRVRGTGDQHYAVFESLDGYTVVRNPVTGYYEYASLSADGTDLEPTGTRARPAAPDNLTLPRSLRVSRAAARAQAGARASLFGTPMRWQVRRAQEREALRATRDMPGVHPAPPPQHTTGSFTGLCLPIQFPDLAGQFTPAQIDAFCNQEGFSGFGNNGSVFDYFLDSSLGRLRYKNIVAPYHTASQPRAFYTDESVQWGLRAQELIREALEALVDSGFDFGPLTTDAAGFVHAINVLYAGSVDNAWSTGLWPHSASLGSFALVPGKKAADYQMCAMDTALPLGTFCHENGHMLCSFPDLYDLGQQSQGVGNYCVMSYGQGFQRNPVSVLGYLKFKAGWANTVRRITDGMTTSLGAGTNDFAIHRKNDTEYVLIENRHQAGRDAELPGSGLAIWHVDELGSNDQEVMTPAAHYECALVQADGQFDLELTPRNYGDAQDFYRAGGVDRLADDTTPNSRWWDGTPSNLEIHSVGPAGPAITFSARL